MLVGVLGGGQLGRMLALAGYPLGLQFRLYDPAPESPAEHVAEFECGEFHDLARLERFCRGLAVVTYEFENVPVAAVEHCARFAAVLPAVAALGTAQDRLLEKQLFGRLGVPTPRFAAVDALDQLSGALATVGAPAVLKTRRGGYDGKGQYVLRRPEDVPLAWAALGARPASDPMRSGNRPALILEEFVDFERELSLIAVRGRDGATAYYPLVQNVHRGGILRESRAPAPCTAVALQEQAQLHAERVLQALDYVGVLTIEFFARGAELLANEMAPRVHNSGHWTIEGSVASQFENHLRAILGLPLGSTRAVGQCVMLNLIGAIPPAARLLSVPGAHLHLYGKSPRPGRKVGHVTIYGDEPAELEERAAAVRALVASDP